MASNIAIGALSRARGLLGGAWCSGTCCTWVRSTTRRSWHGGDRSRCREAARSDLVSCDGNRVLPLGGCFGSEDPKCGPRDEMSLMVEGVVDGGMDIEKTLRGSRRLELLHLALSSPHDLMGVFSAIVLCALTRCTVLPGENPGRQTLAPAGSTRGGSGGDEWSEAL